MPKEIDEQRLLRTMYKKYNARNEESLVTALIESFPKGSLVRQLKFCRVQSIHLIAFDERWPVVNIGVNWRGLLQPDPSVNGFRVFLLADAFSIAELRDTMGHELGHTLFFRPTTMARVANVTSIAIPAEERICDRFSEGWSLRFPENSARLEQKLRNLVDSGRERIWHIPA